MDFTGLERKKKVEDKILGYVNGVAEKKGETVYLDTDLFETGIMDSLEIISLLSYLEEELNVNFTPDDLQFENYQTVRKIVKWAEGRLI